MRTPYQGYSQILVGETELFYACIKFEDPTIYTAWTCTMQAYLPIFLDHKTQAHQSPIAKVLEPLHTHLTWLREEGGKSEVECVAMCVGILGVLDRVLDHMRIGDFAKLRWTDAQMKSDEWLKALRELVKPDSSSDEAGSSSEAVPSRKRPHPEPVPVKKRGR